MYYTIHCLLCACTCPFSLFHFWKFLAAIQRNKCISKILHFQCWTCFSRRKWWQCSQSQWFWYCRSLLLKANKWRGEQCIVVTNSFEMVHFIELHFMTEGLTCKLVDVYCKKIFMYLRCETYSWKIRSGIKNEHEKWKHIRWCTRINLWKNWGKIQCAKPELMTLSIHSLLYWLYFIN